ncbi:MAG: hypothetical protein ACI9A7_002318 [Cyclobacteriaceae bacterium]|jgi:hypothetical protein
MIKDIQFPEVADILMTVVKEADEEWKVYIINRSKEKIENVMVTSNGFGNKKGESQKTSTLRHMIPHIESGEFALIEPIEPEVFHLNNQYWVSFFVGKQLFDKKYIFVPDSIAEENLSFIEELKLSGVIHP